MRDAMPDPSDKNHAPIKQGADEALSTFSQTQRLQLNSYIRVNERIARETMQFSKVNGEKKHHKVVLYALSTCVWCKMTKQYLQDNGIEYEYIDVDLCTEEDKQKIRQDIQSKGGPLSYPTTIIDDRVVVTGFRKDLLKEALEI
jgi:glutaredoxin-like protein NrdH